MRDGLLVDVARRKCRFKKIFTTARRLATIRRDEGLYPPPNLKPDAIAGAGTREFFFSVTFPQVGQML